LYSAGSEHKAGKVDIVGFCCFNAHTMNCKSNESRAASHGPQDTGYESISIIGDGGMGTVLAMLLLEKFGIPPKTEVRMWGYDRRQLIEIAQNCENKKFLPGYKLPDALVFEPDDARIMDGADLIVSAVPCQFMRRVWSRLKDYAPSAVPIVSVAKGIENDTLLRPTQILSDVLDVKRGTVYAVLSGPTIADELARKLPATACVASNDEELAKRIQYVFNCSWLRVYTNTDIVGVELAAACKNIIAIAAGIIDGVEAGDNAKAALLTRGLAEITRLGLAMGAKPATFAGLAGLGDLVTTCISPKGRNRSLGERIGKGQTLEQAQSATESIVEGVATCKSVVALAAQYDVEIPITQAVYEVLFKNKMVRTAIDELMSRQLKAE
jgi:glycerol-3-phosphate dehydrogenase (NAD(P)+)